ncbi:MAG TPA: hypothetical protein VN696_16255 [Pyrinomonadaceae bacterium]|nr:hypothetical protein [Pyrinomonadaceae bacterium]
MVTWKLGVVCQICASGSVAVRHPDGDLVNPDVIGTAIATQLRLH